MRQGWIQIAGLVADITGFLLIVTEWWNAVIRERAVELFHTAKRYEALASDIAATTPRGAFSKRLINYLMRALLDERSKTLSRAQQLEAHDPIVVFRKRLRNFVCGATLVIIGFLLQVLSAIPGGLPQLGILP
jgi:hypothetical protein